MELFGPFPPGPEVDRSPVMRSAQSVQGQDAQQRAAAMKLSWRAMVASLFVRVARRTQNGLRRLLQRYGPPPLKRQLWDREFAGGRWECLEQMGQDCIYPHLERYANHGSILDLGCGPGTTAIEVNPAVYHLYTGVDISAVALQKARRRSQQHDHAGTHEFVQADIAHYRPTHAYDVILAGDLLYYLPPPQITPTLARYAQSLKPGGVLLIKLNGMPKHQPLVHRIEEAFDVVEKQFYPPDVYVIACRPHAATEEAPTGA